MTLCIVGGGVAGLAAAHYALRAPGQYHRILVLEASDRLGGWVRTLRSRDGVLLEKGPRTIRPAGAQVILDSDWLTQNRADF